MAAPPRAKAGTTQAAFVHSAELDRYPYPADCPFSSARAGQARQILLSTGLLHGSDRREVAPCPAGRQTLERFHSPAYLDALQRAPQGRLDVEDLRMGLGTPDCPVFRGMYEYASLACGATLTGTDLVLTGQARVAFSPSGGFHHARPARAAGFCYVNDVALACLRLADEGWRVVFLDVDAHHGDGVQEAFYHRRDVMTISLHESGQTLFPGGGWEEEIGTGEGRGYSVNVPLPAGTYDEAFLRAFDAVAVPLIAAYAPDVIVLELGMDGLAGDPLAHLELTNNVYVEVIRRVLSAGRPVVATGGGGYHVQNTARGWALAWSALCGQEGADEQLAAGLGGVMLQSTDWSGGLRDRARPADPRRRRQVEPAVEATVQKVRRNVFAFHGL